MDIIIYDIEKIEHNCIEFILLHDNKGLNHFLKEFEKKILEVMKHQRPFHFGDARLDRSTKYPLHQFMHKNTKNEYYIINNKMQKIYGEHYFGKITFYALSKDIFIKDSAGNTKKTPGVIVKIYFEPKNYNITRLIELRFANPYFRDKIFDKIKIYKWSKNQIADKVA